MKKQYKQNRDASSMLCFLSTWKNSKRTEASDDSMSQVSFSIPSPYVPSLRHISQRPMTTRTRAKANVGNDVTPAKEGIATRQRRQASDSSGTPSQTSLPPIEKAVKRTSNVDQSDDDDDEPVEIQVYDVNHGIFVFCKKILLQLRRLLDSPIVSFLRGSLVRYEMVSVAITQGQAA